ncbi:hypothetical protein NDU88_006627 [Pleurodeles waltl]|uniref:Uncharacterized protein n=1 Tax=Pleurodeles waltl TaxID=8319 RepID=A0AAV7VRI4_PLEWA|nr:hypothetical protein NDU88_006627 [Pleurodeles waltl]
MYSKTSSAYSFSPALRHQYHGARFAGRGPQSRARRSPARGEAPGRGAKSRHLLQRARHARPRRLPQQASPYPRARPRLFSSGEGAFPLRLTSFRASFQSFAHPYRGARVSGRDQRSRPRRSSARRGFQVAEPGPGNSRAARGTPVGGGPVSRQAPISGPAKAPRAQPPFLNCHSGRGQRSRLGVCQYWHQRSLQGPGARGSG